MNSPLSRPQSDALARDFENVVSDARDLLQTMGNEGDSKLKEARNKMAASLSTATERLRELQETITERAKETAKVTDEYVRENPWYAIGVAAAVGAVIALVVSRR